MASNQSAPFKRIEPKRSASVEFMGGCIAGVLQVLVGQPFDTVKVRLQTQPADHKIYNGVLDCVAKIWKGEGPGAFYKGTAFPLAGIAACVSIQFGVVEASKRQLKKIFNTNHLNTGLMFVAGSISGAANSVVSTSVEHLRIRMQVTLISLIQDKQNRIYQNSLDCFRKILGTYGIQGVYKGSGITLVRELWCYGIYFSSYELALGFLKSPEEANSRVALWKSGLAGSFAGILFWFLGYPIDILKTRIQADSFETPKYRGTLDCYRQLMKIEGPKAFTNGLVPCVTRAIPVNFASFIAYDSFVNSFTRY